MIKLDLYSKNWSRMTPEPLRLESFHIPRVGEIVDVGNLLGQTPDEVSTFIVLDVTWDYDDGSLTPTLKCLQWYKGDRKMELQSQGWL